LTGRRAVFLDRDGVVNALVPDPDSGLPESPLRAEDVSLIQGVPAAMRRLSGAGFLIIGVSNQPAAAKGRADVAAINAVQGRVLELLEDGDVGFDDFRICLHHPDGVVPELAHECECRKPAAGMLLDAARSLGIDLARSAMVGDSDVDVLAGAAAGCATFLVENPESAHRRAGSVEPDARVRDLSSAVALLVGSSAR
jgi:D-glycero-D-manno-heptose 1,7-bisphosphate phosphatase